MENLISKSLGYTVIGTEISVLAGSFIYQKEDFSKDYSPEVDVIKSKLMELEGLGEPKVVLIKGDTGSGKSLLAAVLHSTIPDSKLIDVLESKIDDKPVDFALPLAPSAGGLYIIDGLEFATQESVGAVCKSILDVAGSMIILTQMFDYLQAVQGSRLTLTRNDLVEN